MQRQLAEYFRSFIKGASTASSSSIAAAAAAATVSSSSAASVAAAATAAFTSNLIEAASASSPSSLLDLPQNVEEKIYASLPVRTLGLFAKVSHHAEAGTAFLRLLESAVEAEPESYQQADETELAAMAILQRHPELLFECRGGRVTDHYRRKIKGSPYRILLGAGDTWALKQVHQSIIPNIENGEDLVEAEFKAQFPHCPWPPTPDMPEEMFYDDRNKAQIAAVKAQLQIIVAKITADPCTNGQATLAETTQAVADLCQIFAPKEGEVIQTGLHFPLGIMKEIFKVYDAQFNSWDGGQLAFFVFNVIGSAAEASAAVDGQCYKYGLVNLNMAQGPDRRDGLFCRHPKGIPEDKAPLVGKLGRTMFVDPYNGYSCFASSTPGIFDWYNKNVPLAGLLVGWVPRAAGTAAAIGQLMENKSRDYWQLLCDSSQRSQHTGAMTARCHA